MVYEMITIIGIFFNLKELHNTKIDAIYSYQYLFYILDLFDVMTTVVW